MRRLRKVESVGFGLVVQNIFHFHDATNVFEFTKFFTAQKDSLIHCRPFKVMSTRCNSYLYAQIFSSTSNNIAAVYFHYTLVKPSVLSFNFSAILLEMLQKARYSDFVVQSILLASGELDIKFFISLIMQRKFVVSKCFMPIAQKHSLIHWGPLQPSGHKHRIILTRTH